MTRSRARPGSTTSSTAHMADLIRKKTVERRLRPARLRRSSPSAAPARCTRTRSRAGSGCREIVVPLGDVASVYSAYGVAVLGRRPLARAPAADEGAVRLRGDRRDLRRARGRGDASSSAPRASPTTRSVMTPPPRRQVQRPALRGRGPDRRRRSPSEGGGAASLADRFTRKYEELYGAGAGYLRRRARDHATAGCTRPAGRRACRRCRRPNGHARAAAEGTREVHWPHERQLLDTAIYRPAPRSGPIDVDRPGDPRARGHERAPSRRGSRRTARSPTGRSSSHSRRQDR